MSFDIDDNLSFDASSLLHSEQNLNPQSLRKYHNPLKRSRIEIGKEITPDQKLGHRRPN